ncbi:hypothetical protein NIES4071_81080 [Calothrix sp. NIES-4071]|nr:hypothetical protein NIES4071_81080 [Calothrix sp. NIES-4071]BAZ62378.1 hypothetical protein NIES4105_81010 [Calothrix sp. NIES-4105]
MAWVFSLSAECGSDQARAQEFSEHFNGAHWTLSNGAQSQCRVSIFQDIEDNWWCRVCPNNISESGVDTPETAYLMTELGILLYQRLLSAPSFRYALVGVEVDEFRTYSELLEDLPNLAFPGLVLALGIWQEAGSPQTFQPFSMGYVWKTYEGEVYKPLMASPDLKTKLNNLLTVQ